jgi:hypothetical protein
VREISHFARIRNWTTCAYLWRMDRIKRQQLAKGGALLAQTLNTIWP